MKFHTMLLAFIVSSTIGSAVSPQVIYESNCASCHGKKGESKALGQSDPIQGIEVEKFVTTVNGFASGELEANQMAKLVKQSFVKKYSAEELKAVGEYLHRVK
jgi:mono/diheme cytochrome c family protein